MNFLLSVDPSLTCTGWAWWQDGVLIDAGFDGSKDTTLSLGKRINIASGFEQPNFGATDFPLVIEWPQIYGRSKGDPNDLLALAAVAGAYIGKWPAVSEIYLVKPREWKGQIPKEIKNARDAKSLSVAEWQILTELKIPKGKFNNVMDAVGLGLWFLKKKGLR